MRIHTSGRVLLPLFCFQNLHKSLSSGVSPESLPWIRQTGSPVECRPHDPGSREPPYRRTAPRSDPEARSRIPVLRRPQHPDPASRIFLRAPDRPGGRSSSPGVLHGGKNGIVFFIRTALIPQPVDHQLFPAGGLPKGKALPKIFRKGHSQIVCLKRVQGHVDLVQGRGAKQQFLVLSKQRTVGRQNDLKSSLSRKLQKPFQLWMAQRLPHEVKIKIIRPWPQFGQQGSKFFFRQSPGFPLGSGAETAF